MAVARGTLFREDWFQYQKWDADIQAGNVFSAIDNYETQVVFLIMGYQYIVAAVIRTDQGVVQFNADSCQIICYAMFFAVAKQQDCSLSVFMRLCQKH
jgi:hypothetical protein